MLLLRIKPSFYGPDCYDCGCGTYDGMTHESVTETQIVSEMNEYQLSQLGLVKVTPDDNKKMSKTALDTLKQKGWVFAASVEDRAKRKEMEQKFYILNENGKPYSYYNPTFGELDLDNLDENQIAALADGAKIVQVVTAKSVLSENDYKRYQKVKKQKEEAAAKKKQTKEQKEQAKKLKEIEKAKKLLAEAGELKE
jgi:hypothetical protein